ncbi:MAG: BBP7 family outer membrane beta-barrel protein, partial [Gemmataceae bacterium]
ELDYVLYWLKPVCFTVPGLSIGDPNDPEPGVFGQPGTRLIQGDHKFEFRGANGLRSRLGFWLTKDQFLGVETEGFVLEQVTASQDVVAGAANPPVFLVFQNPDGTNAALPFSIPGVVNGSSTAVGQSQMWGLETNLAIHFHQQRGPWTLHATGLFGCRYLHLEDRVIVTNRQSLVSEPSITAVGEAQFATRNQFVGGQLGSRLGVERGPWQVDLTTKLAFGETHLVSMVAGGPLLSGASVAPPLVPGPLLALPSNVGQSSSNRITVVPELNLRVRWRFLDGCYVTVGYNLLYWNKILCPGDQMDRQVNITALPFRGPLVGRPAPAPKFVFTDTFRQGLEAGLGINF